MNPTLSIVIPAYNRIPALLFTLDCLVEATKELSTEIIIVDDGSEPSVESELHDWKRLSLRFIRQENSGSAVAKHVGIMAAKGNYITILDSDDLVSPEKFIKQIKLMEESDADISYTDECSWRVDGEFEIIERVSEKPMGIISDSVSLLLDAQPFSNNLVYRKTYIQQALTTPLVEPSKPLSPIGDVWIYYNLAVFPAKICYVPSELTIRCIHETGQYSNNWEKLGIAALFLMEQFIANCPETERSEIVRAKISENLLSTWKRLPICYNKEYERRMHSLLKQLGYKSSKNIGGDKFHFLERIFGIKNAIRITRMITRPRYGKVRTMSASEFNKLLSQVAPPAYKV